VPLLVAIEASFGGFVSGYSRQPLQKLKNCTSRGRGQISHTLVKRAWCPWWGDRWGKGKEDTKDTRLSGYIYNAHTCVCQIGIGFYPKFSIIYIYVHGLEISRWWTR
jgi:hypothetical protein